MKPVGDVDAEISCFAWASELADELVTLLVSDHCPQCISQCCFGWLGLCGPLAGLCVIVLLVISAT